MNIKLLWYCMPEYTTVSEREAERDIVTSQAGRVLMHVVTYAMLRILDARSVWFFA